MAETLYPTQVMDRSRLGRRSCCGCTFSRIGAISPAQARRMRLRVVSTAAFRGRPSVVCRGAGRNHNPALSPPSGRA